MATRVLIVDDSLTVRSMVKMLLGAADYAYVEAERAERALQLLESAEVDLIVADINMPGMDGVTFVRIIRGYPRAAVRSLPIILLSGDKSAAVQAKGLEAGATEFVSKPLTRSNLVDAVLRVLQKRK